MSTTATRNQPITAQVQHDGVDTTSYDLKQNGVVIASQPLNTAGVSFSFPNGFAAGSYTMSVVAKGPAGSTEYAPVQLVIALGVPSQPVMIVRAMKKAGVRFIVVGSPVSA